MAVSRAPRGVQGIAMRLDDLRLKQMIKIRLKGSEAPIRISLNDLIAEARLQLGLPNLNQSEAAIANASC